MPLLLEGPGWCAGACSYVVCMGIQYEGMGISLAREYYFCGITGGV